MGFPSDKIIFKEKRVVFEGVSDRLLVKDIDTDNIELRAERKYLVQIGDQLIPSMDRNLGGYSGAGVWGVKDSSLNIQSFKPRPVGVIYQTSRNLISDKPGEEEACIIVRKIDVINPDGTLQKNNQ